MSGDKTVASLVTRYTPPAGKALPGILTLRAQKTGWEQIPAQLGYKLQ